MTTKRAIETLEAYGFDVKQLRRFFWSISYNGGKADVVGEYQLTQIALECESNSTPSPTTTGEK